MAIRIFDSVFSLVVLIFLFPLFLIVAVLIKLDSKGPVFFFQERIGYKGKPFYIWKFRTFAQSADTTGLNWPVENQQEITRVGVWLRKLKINEFPQFINVLFGTMALVGPRPELPRYVALYTVQQKTILDYMPGITDPATLKYSREGELLGTSTDPDGFYIQKIMPEKIRISLEYAGKATLFSNIQVIFDSIQQICGVKHEK